MRTVFGVLFVLACAVGPAAGGVEVSVSPGAAFAERDGRLAVDMSFKANIAVDYRHARLENEGFWQSQKNCASAGCNLFSDSLALSIFPYRGLFVRGGVEYRSRRMDVTAYDQEAFSVHGGVGLESPRSDIRGFNGWTARPPAVHRLAVTAGKNTWSRNVDGGLKFIQAEYREDRQLGKRGASPWYVRCDLGVIGRTYTPYSGPQQKDIYTKFWIGLAYRN